MKNINLSVILLLISTLILAQGVSINNTGNAPATNSILDVSSTTKGMLIPRMTTVQRTTLTPGVGEDGMLVYDTDTESYWYYDVSATVWIPFLSGSASNNGGWRLTGNIGTTAGANFLGTTDAKDVVFKTNNSEAMRIDQNGNVGIGLTGPTEKLEISGGGIQLNGDYGIGFSGELPSNGNVVTDAFKFYRDENFFGASNDAFVIEKTDDSQVDPDGGIAFTNKGNDNVRETAMVIKGTGNVGIGTISPGHALDVVGDVRFSGFLYPDVDDGAYIGTSTLNFWGAYITRTYTAIIREIDGTNVINMNGVRHFYSPVGSLAMSIDNNNNVGIGTTTPAGQLELSLDQGRKPGGGTWTTTSDERLKNIEGDYTKGLKEILQLEPITYYYKNVGDRIFEEEVLNTLNVGFSAQEVQKIFPEAVGTDADGYLNFNMHAILVAYVNAIKELKEENDALKSEISEMNVLISKVEEIDALKLELKAVRSMIEVQVKK
ncbi:MAG: hypothetical protein COA57_11990 [Flavobacteriales bacterium]|nr:MAG: hypothetical protein COA57_11990 [Flavobacteriales bacterium]